MWVLTKRAAIVKPITDGDCHFQAYDSHCNLVLGEVEETIYIVEEDENEEETIRVCHTFPYPHYRDQTDNATDSTGWKIDD